MFLKKTQNFVQKIREKPYVTNSDKTPGNGGGFD
jgi:hypothetical protein